jgi:translocation and assembly module TamB
MDQAAETRRGAGRARRIAILAGVAVALLVTLAVAARFAAGGPIGRSVLANALDGRAVGSLGVISVEGLAGDPLRDLRIARLAIADEQGPWLEIEDARLVWRPAALLGNVLHIEALEAGRVRLSRRPPTGTGEARSGGGLRGDWRFIVESLAAPRIELGEPVLGTEAVLAAVAGLSFTNDGALEADLDLRRTDVPGDSLTLHASRDGAGRIEVAADLTAPAGGPIAALARLPSQTLLAHAELGGEAQAGSGRLTATLGDAPFVDVSGDWRDGAGRAQASLQLAAAPELAAFVARFGPQATAELALGAPRAGLRSLSLELRSDGLALDAQGPVDLAERSAPEGLEITAATPWLDRLIGEAVSSRAALGAAEAEGRLSAVDGYAFDGAIRVADVGYGDWGAAQIAGPATLSYARGVLQVDSDLAAESARAPGALAAILGDAPRLGGTLAYDHPQRRIETSGLALAAAAGEANGAGAVDFRGGAITAQIAADVMDASRLPGLTGGAGRIELTIARGARGEPFAFEIAGTGERLEGESEIVSELLGAQSSFNGSLTLSGAGAEIESASLRGEKFTLTARGAAGRANGYDLDIDAAVEGPLSAGLAVIDGAATVAARLEGGFDAPLLRLDARADELAAGPVALAAPRLRAELADVFDAPSGTLAFDAETDEGPAALTAEIAYSEGRLTARSIIGGWNGFDVVGEAGRAPDTGMTATLALSGLRGRLAADLRLGDAEGPAQLDLHLTLRDQPIGDAGALSALTIALLGPLDALEIAASARGFAGSTFTLEAAGLFERDDGTTRLTLTPRGTMGGDAIAAPEPWTASLSGEETLVSATLDAGGGQLAVRLERRNGRTSLNADLIEAPLSLVNLFRPDPRLEGRASASVSVSGARLLEGESRLEIVGARAPDYAPDAGLDLTLTMTHDANGADVALAASDVAGFRARVDGRAPLVLDAWPTRPRFDRAAPVTIEGDASGDVAALWALVGLPVIALDGEIDARGALTGTLEAPAFEGEAAVSGGRIEEARIGLLLTDVEGSARLEGPRLVVEEITARDDAEGRVRASGEVEFGGAPGSNTRARLEVSNLQAVRTSENSAVLSGALDFTRGDDGARLAGALTVERAELTPPRGGGEGAASVPTLEVTEINRPEDLAEAPTSRRQSLALDLTLSADRRVFIRSSSLDTEWAFNVAIGGTTADPELRGTATLVRGDLVLAGERFSLDQARITFDGEVADAALDLVARRESADISVTARITGTASEPVVRLTSTPSYPEDEIIARVLYGRSTSELTALEAAQLAAALASLAGGGGVDLLGPLRQTLGIDRLSVGPSGSGGALVSGGRYLAEDLYLEVASTSTGLAQAAIEWEIRPRLELVSRFGAGRDASIALRWRKDY